VNPYFATVFGGHLPELTLSGRDLPQAHLTNAEPSVGVLGTTCPRTRQIRSWTKSWWLKYAHRLGCRVLPLPIFWRRRDWRGEVRMMSQILLHRLVAQHEPESSLRGHIDGLLQIQFVQVNHVFD
jgi:hypothetical protein